MAYASKKLAPAETKDFNFRRNVWVLCGGVTKIPAILSWQAVYFYKTDHQPLAHIKQDQVSERFA